VQECAHHLLARGGKYLRPLCVALSAKAGSGFSESARHLAVAVELVHNATLLHDDVVDLGSVRRGVATPREVYGNAASIYAGDWLLVQALMRIQRAGVGGLVDRMLEIIDEMILAESLQLENRGRLNASFEDYFRVVEGKTAALFRWAMFAGGRAGGLPTAQCTALENFGLHLGVAFQLIDDLLDFEGEVDATGKTLFADLREGKMTYPVLLLLRERPDMRPAIEQCIGNEADLDPAIVRQICDALSTTGSLQACRELAQDHADRAAESVSCLDDREVRSALASVARATTLRRS
jgi:octaprenyl-diphosphate synthase